MDTLNTTINYQPTGVYAQFAQNPMLLNQGAAKKQAAADSWRIKKDEVPFSEKVSKFAKKAGVIGGLAVIGFGIYKYIDGMRAIKLKEKLFPGVTEETIGQFMNNKFSDEQRDYFLTKWNEGNVQLKGTVGKIHNGIQSVRNFFRENFFNY